MKQVRFIDASDSDFEPPEREVWMDRAACLTVDPEVFFPPRGVKPAKAKIICSGCEVRIDCLLKALKMEGAVRSSSREGIFGGLNGYERHKITQTIKFA